jgi:tetratricopeptide (TPR) repeat protein
MSESLYENKRVLIVDSFKTFRDTLKLIVHSLGVMKIDLASTAKQGLYLSKEKHYDIILMGYDLGEGRNGQQILEELRVNNHLKRSTIFVLITAESSQSIVLSSLEHKPEGYLVKPFTAKQLTSRLHAYINKKRTMAKIYQAMDDGEHQKVIQFCDEHILNNDKYSNECLGIKSRQLFELERFDEAKEIYLAKRDEKDCQWALIGLGKIYLKQQEYPQALETFLSIIETSPLYLSAYDWIAKTYEDMANYDEAEITLEKAIAISPRSVKRMKNYAQLCKNNNKIEKSLNAYKKMVALAKYSIHNSPENALNFAQALLDHKALPPGNSREVMYRDAFKALSEMVKDFNNNDVKLRSKLLSACMHKNQQAMSNAQENLKEAERIQEKLGDDIAPELMIDIAKSHSFFEQDEQALEILQRLAAEHSNNPELIDQIDAAVDEPISAQGKAATQHSVKIGIDYYNQHKYDEAIKEFSLAERKYPRHMGIRLNLMQALLMAYEQDNSQESYKDRCQRYLEQLADLPKNSSHYSRYNRIRDRFHHILAEQEKQKRQTQRRGLIEDQE